LTIDEKAQIVNTLLRGYRTQALTLSQPGAAKERTLEAIEGEVDRFYAKSVNAIERYVTTMNAKIAEREFFGRETAMIQRLRATQSRRLTRILQFKRGTGLREGTSQETYKEHISRTVENYQAGQERLERLKARPLSETIGGFVFKLQAEGEIQPSQEKEISDLLKAIFDPLGMSKWIGRILNSPLQAITQIDEFAYALYRSPIKAIPAGIRTIARRSRLTPRQLGFRAIGREYEDVSLRRVLTTMLKVTGFETIDRLNPDYNAQGHRLRNN
jgi:hypothetical protein